MAGTLAEEVEWPRERLDRDYSARATVSVERFETEMRRSRSLSDAMREPWATHLDVVYDEASGQTLDVFGTGGALRPAFMFIHGGYWRLLSKRDSAFMAGTLAKHGIASVAVDYRLAPEATLTEIVREMRAAIAFLWKNGRRYGIDPERIYVGGSSAGGHLAGTVISGGWQRHFGVPENVVKGAMPISGLFHLAPIAKSFAQDWLSLDDDAVKTLSPAENLPVEGCPIVIAYADGEAEGFKRQSAEYHRLWREAGFSSTLMEIPDRNHFDVILDLAEEDAMLTQALLRLIHGDAA
ncbi:MAG TPA: alpha/beta hydrolase [Rhizobiaceae bacterium]|nr:alpha/beta hydrolase [Rhizobiaceae bacterium]